MGRIPRIVVDGSVLAVTLALTARAAAEEAAPPAPVEPPPVVAPAPSAAPVVAPVAAPAAASAPTLQLSTLRVMREKGIITEEEYQSALHDVSETSGAKGQDSSTVVLGKWSATIYGFVEADYVFDSTESYNDLAGIGLVARSGTYAGDHPRTQFSVRNTRLGFRFRAPEYKSIRASAQIEMDFLGDWASPTYTGATGQPTENQFFSSPVPRLRHAFLKLETPVVDVLFGQTWQLFGWQTTYHPNTVQLQGVPGELYARAPQLRLSKTFAGKDATLEIALAAAKPVQRDSAVPDGQGGLRFALNKWTGVQTAGATGTSIMPASIAVTGDVRRFGVANYPSGGTAAAPETKSTYEVGEVGGGVAVDAFVPILAASKEHRGNSLAVLGEFVRGQGIADFFTGLTSGLEMPALVPVPAGSPPGTVSTVAYNPQIDAGLVMVDAKGNVSVIQWQTVRAGVQYYLPGLDGRMWLSANYANVSSPNAPSLVTVTPATATAKATTNASSIRNALNWFDVNVMGDITPAVRLGAEYAYSADKYADGVTAVNHRVQGSAFYIF